MQRKEVKKCHTSFDICKALIQKMYFSKYSISLKSRLVILSIASHWNHATGIAYPTIKRMCAETGLSKVSVINAIEELRQEKWIMTVKYNGRLNYMLTNVLIDLLNAVDESITEVQNENQNGKNLNIEGKEILPFYIKTNNKQIKEKNLFLQNGLRGVNPVKPILEQYELDKQTAVSPFDDRDCALDVLKTILKPETYRHAFARKMFRDIQAKWQFDENTLEQLKKDGV